MSASSERALEAAITVARTTLANLGTELLYEQADKVLQLVNMLESIASRPEIEVYGTVFGGLASQQGRIGIVLERLGIIAGDALDTAGSEDIGNDIPSLAIDIPLIPHPMNDREARLQQELSRLNGGFELLAADLLKLVNLDLSFLSCDMTVLEEHPSISNSPATLQLLDEAENLLSAISVRFYFMAEEATAATHPPSAYAYGSLNA